MLRNQVQLIGRLGNDPEVKHLDSGKVVANLSLATNGYYTNAKGEKVEDTQWHRLVLWGNFANRAEKYLKKGSEIAVQGKLTYKTFEAKGGETKYYTDVVVNDLVMLGKAPSADQN